MRAAPKPAVYAAGMGLPSLSGLRRWLNGLVGQRDETEDRSDKSLHYFICKVFIHFTMPWPISSNFFLVPTGTAAPCRRREPTVFEATSAGGE